MTELRVGNNNHAVHNKNQLVHYLIKNKLGLR